jgi:predicted DCC family thiol-disulfide oxidoreductase YuxK
MSSDAAIPPILLYDGTCGFCALSVQWVLAHERQPRRLRFASLQGEWASTTPGLGEAAREADSVLWCEPGTGVSGPVILARSDAVIAILRYVGGGWRLLAEAGQWIPRQWRDRMYDLVARHRHALGGSACLLPSEDQRHRFLD